MVSSPARIYWDACAWIGLVNNEADKVHALRLVWEAAQQGKCDIYTSTYIYLEFIKGVAPHGEPYTPEEHDSVVENMLNQSYVRRIQLDVVTARLARKLKRDLHKEGLSKRPDAVHLASAIMSNAGELHTYDQSDLLQFDRKLKSRAGKVLRIIRADHSEFGVSLFNLPGSEPEDERKP